MAADVGSITDIAKSWGWLLAALLSLLLAWVGWSFRKQFVTADDHEKAVKQLTGKVDLASKEAQAAQDKANHLEQKLETLATAQEVADLRVEIGTIKASVDGTNKLMEAHGRTLDRIATFLLNDKAGNP
jgi:uncharacterized protein YoxC